MRIVDLLGLSTRMFRVRPSRTWLTIFGISIGIGAVLCLVSLGYGLQKILLEKIMFDDAMLTVTVLPENSAIAITTENLEQLSRLNGVDDVCKVAAIDGQVSLSDINSVLPLQWVDKKFFSYAGKKLLTGHFFTSNQLYTPQDNHADEAVVDESALRLLGFTNSVDIIGKKLGVKISKLSETTADLSIQEARGSSSTTVERVDYFTVVGVVEAAAEPEIYLPLEHLRNETSIDNYKVAHIRVKDQDFINSVKQEVINAGYRAQTLSDVVDQANKIFGIVQIVLGVFGAVALAVSFVGMFNTMTVALLERTGEIGVMRALGAKRRDIAAIFLSEAFIIGVLGGLVGILLGMGFGEVFNIFINTLAAHFGGQPVNLFVYPQKFLLAIIGLSIIIGVGSGLAPARKAAHLDPLSALRYK